MAEIDALLQTVMFTIYGNQYESREEHLLLTMFQVNSDIHVLNEIYANSKFPTPIVRLDLSIRQYSRIFFVTASEHSGLSDDDYIHPARSWPKLPKDGIGGSY